MTWTILRPFAPYLGALLAILSAYACGDHNGYRRGVAHEKAAEAKRLDAAKKAIAKHEAKADRITTDLAQKLTTERVRIEYRTRYLTQEITRYVPAPADVVRLPVGFRLLHDRAALGDPSEVPEPPGGFGKPDPGLAPSTVLETVVGNYGACHSAIAEVGAWRKWYRDQERAWK